MLNDTNKAISTDTRHDVYTFAEQMLLNRIFMGDYQEKRYVQKLNTYKDLIVLNRQEKILCDDLARVKNHILMELPNTCWFGYTTPDTVDVDAPAVNCIWATLDTNESHADDTLPQSASVSFGGYWFQIKGIHSVLDGVELQIEILRPIENPSISIGPTIQTLTQQMLEVDSTKIQQYVQENIVDVNWLQLFQQFMTDMNQTAYRFFSTEITWNNFMRCLQLLGVFLVAFTKWSCQFVYSLGEFSIRLIVELNKLLKTATPIILAMINLCSKIFGGLYLLLAMIWRDLFGDSGQNRNRKNDNQNEVPSTGFGRRPIRAPPVTYRDYDRNYRQRAFNNR